MGDYAANTTYEGMDCTDVFDDGMSFGDTDQSQPMQISIDEAAMPANFSAANMIDDSMDEPGDQASGSTPARELFGERRTEALIEQTADALSSVLAGRHLSISVGSRYASEYFCNAHPMWPFLHQKQWDDCWNRWTSPANGGSRVAWMDFFVDMVCVAVNTGDYCPLRLTL